ncbi:hypothetical protein DM02DRAFT_724650 [Periconia macrospinosa]|uniref:Uncharacterized protein n=1 Tax=Periconia macrospinosa TaxID=97972 RepID=A0A2V1E6Y7_9PLEO|nr:hypothetical protein DM02DRAFT_724650 [Periconia macrospinosa]
MDQRQKERTTVSILRLKTHIFEWFTKRKSQLSGVKQRRKPAEMDRAVQGLMAQNRKPATGAAGTQALMEPATAKALPHYEAYIIHLFDGDGSLSVEGNYRIEQLLLHHEVIAKNMVTLMLSCSVLKDVSSLSHGELRVMNAKLQSRKGHLILIRREPTPDSATKMDEFDPKPVTFVLETCEPSLHEELVRERAPKCSAADAQAYSKRLADAGEVCTCVELSEGKLEHYMCHKFVFTRSLSFEEMRNHDMLFGVMPRPPATDAWPGQKLHRPLPLDLPKGVNVKDWDTLFRARPPVMIKGDPSRTNKTIPQSLFGAHPTFDGRQRLFDYGTSVLGKMDAAKPLFIDGFPNGKRPPELQFKFFPPTGDTNPGKKDTGFPRRLFGDPIPADQLKSIFGNGSPPTRTLFGDPLPADQQIRNPGENIFANGLFPNHPPNLFGQKAVYPAAKPDAANQGESLFAKLPKYPAAAGPDGLGLGYSLFPQHRANVRPEELFAVKGGDQLGNKLFPRKATTNYFAGAGPKSPPPNAPLTEQNLNLKTQEVFPDTSLEARLSTLDRLGRSAKPKPPRESLIPDRDVALPSIEEPKGQGRRHRSDRSQGLKEDKRAPLDADDLRRRLNAIGEPVVRKGLMGRVHFGWTERDDEKEAKKGRKGSTEGTENDDVD